MARPYTVAATLLLVFFLGQAQAQVQVADLVYRRSPERWVAVGSSAASPVDTGDHFDFALGPDLLPILATAYGPRLSLKKWDGRAWTSLTDLRVVGEAAMAIRMASNPSGDIVVAVYSISLDGINTQHFHVYRLVGSELVELGPGLSIPDGIYGHATAFDGQSPVVALQDDRSVTVHRWNGTDWVRLGGDVNPEPIISSYRESPSLAVTADGRIVVAYTSGRYTTGRAISVRFWTGFRWAGLGDGLPSPSSYPSLGGGNGGAPVAAFLHGALPEVSHWNGSAWSAPHRPCSPPRRGTNFGQPSLAVLAARRGIGPLLLLDQHMIVCGIDTRRTGGRRALVARYSVPGSGWTRLGTGSINGGIALAHGNKLAFVAHADWRGRPWVAWTAMGDGPPRIVVSTLVPVDAPNP